MKSSCDTAFTGVINSCEDSPVVESITPITGSSQQVITITGKGFSLSDCNNIIMFGGKLILILIDLINLID